MSRLSQRTLSANTEVRSEPSRPTVRGSSAAADGRALGDLGMSTAAAAAPTAALGAPLPMASLVIGSSSNEKPSSIGAACALAVAAAAAAGGGARREDVSVAVGGVIVGCCLAALHRPYARVGMRERSTVDEHHACAIKMRRAYKTPNECYTLTQQCGRTTVLATLGGRCVPPAAVSQRGIKGVWGYRRVPSVVGVCRGSSSSTWQGRARTLQRLDAAG